ncbi:serine/threonine protein kinase [Fusarium austroafricanum]|uniref:Serine/threonine protein kinase n=1 Tax=Fusarium austroafricanum TaxID=2364996 RepID=A0A8H4NKN8_9HYPO|nr:serine/threonine protein kinase [Fusarium austroafricanum]
MQAKRVFAILVLIEEAWAITNLICQDNISDEDLPLSRQPSLGENDHNILISVKTGKTFQSFLSWPKEARVRDFLSMQWVVQAPVLHSFGQRISLDPKCPLAMIDCSIQAKRGPNSILHKCKVHEAHQTVFKVTNTLFLPSRSSANKPQPGTDPCVAVKEVLDEKAFEKEKENLEKLQALNHKHLIKLVASCQRGSMFYFIFPWADGGDLKEFWNRHNSRPRSQNLILWSLRQMLGIVSAIHALHGKNMRHGDIKPQNILHFPNCDYRSIDEEGILIIADVGVSKIHREITSMRQDATNCKESTILYEAPEAESDQKENKPRHRRYDMWSLGCMFLEFTLWLVYDYNTVRDFRRSRRSRDDPKESPGSFFIQTSETDVQTHPTVKEAFGHLRSHPLCNGNTALGDLIQLIEDHLLKVDAKQRAHAPELLEKIETIVHTAEQKPCYLYPTSASSTS